MPPASSQLRRAYRADTPGPRGHVPRPQAVGQRLPISKVGWDRKFRLVMVHRVRLVGWIGLKAGLALLSARSQAAQEISLVSSLKAQHRRLVAQEKALHQPATIMRDARQLGMVRAASARTWSSAARAADPQTVPGPAGRCAEHGGAPA